MIGLPSDQTRSEKVLRGLGFLGVGLGGLFIGFAIILYGISFFPRLMGLDLAGILKFFSFGVTAAITGILLAALAQALATFRYLAHSIHQEESSS